MDAMSSKLASVNRYLRDAVVRENTVVRSVATSSAIEGDSNGVPTPAVN
jgi:hypothetical protein